MRHGCRLNKQHTEWLHTLLLATSARLIKSSDPRMASTVIQWHNPSHAILSSRLWIMFHLHSRSTQTSCKPFLVGQAISMSNFPPKVKGAGLPSFYKITFTKMSSLRCIYLQIASPPTQSLKSPTGVRPPSGDGSLDSRPRTIGPITLLDPPCNILNSRGDRIPHVSGRRQRPPWDPNLSWFGLFRPVFVGWGTWSKHPNIGGRYQG